MNIRCPCCQTSFEKRGLFSRDKYPAINNVVYKTEEEARNCSVGSIRLVLCPACNFVFNAVFNENPSIYDENYDNLRIISPTYRNYLEELTSTLSESINKSDTILEIGCGQGEFLKGLCLKTGARGSGYDAVYRGKSKPAANVRFFREYFNPSQSQEKYDIVILRHVLEHIPQPYLFLKEICDGDVLKPGARLWIEVPDYAWILRKEAFYDITYEHCNYFLRGTLRNLLASLGLKVIKLRSVFQGQYILAEASNSPDKTNGKNRRTSFTSLLDSIDKLSEKRQEYDNIIKNSGNACVWGASGKGVIFLAGLGDRLLRNIKYVIDINPQKQGGFLPVSGKKVNPPEILKQAKGKLLVLIMNGIYKDEIKTELARMCVKARTMVV